MDSRGWKGKYKVKVDWLNRFNGACDSCYEVNMSQKWIKGTDRELLHPGYLAPRIRMNESSHSAQLHPTFTTNTLSLSALSRLSPLPASLLLSRGHGSVSLPTRLHVRAVHTRRRLILIDPLLRLLLPMEVDVLQIESVNMSWEVTKEGKAAATEGRCQ